MNLQENNNVAFIALSKIKPSKFNPRKTFKDTDLAELAESIKEQGVLQPIMVRLTSADRYEIVYGERRYRASLLAGMTGISAIVKDIPDNVAVEYALTENLQRKDVSPIEEAIAYKTLIETSHYDTATLIVKFGKSESYIRSRMRLNSLIQPFAELLLNDDINLSVALELCKYSGEVQEEIFADHYQADNYYNWLKKTSKEVVSLIEKNYSTDLNEYFFDKSECYDCEYNSETHNLFSEGNGCGKCLNTTCLKAKNTFYIVERAKEFKEKNPELPLSVTNLNGCKDAIDMLTEQEYEITELNYCRECPKPPTAPDQDDYETDEEYNEALGEYAEEVVDFESNTTELMEQYNEGKITMYANVGTRGVSLGYTRVSTSDKTEVETPLAKLTKQDSRNKELSNEKIIDDTKTLINNTDLTGDFTIFEEKMTYFAMLSFTKQEHFSTLGITEKRYHLYEDDKLQIINNLTDEAKNIIRRDFIIAHLKGAFRTGVTEDLLLEFAEQHIPDGLVEIKAKHHEVYDKRHARITEKIEAIHAQNMAEETADEQEDVGELETDFDQK